MDKDGALVHTGDGPPVQPTETAKQVIRVPAENVADVWLDVQPHIERLPSVSRGEYEPRDIVDLLVKGAMQLWVGYEGEEIQAILVTEIVRHPRYQSCVIHGFSARNMDAWLPHLSTIETWALSLGCKAVEAHGRAGWQKVLDDYKRTHVILRKML